MNLNLSLVLLVAILVCADANEKGEESGSVFKSVLKLISSNSESADCPGRCFNAIASLACREVLDAPGLCPQLGYRCCKNVSTKEEEPTVSDGEKKNSNLPKTEGGAPKDTRVLDEVSNFPSADGKKKANEASTGGPDTAAEKSDDSQELLQYSDQPSIKVCPGVCVAQRISNFCEAAIDAQGLCKPQLRCCVPANLFEGTNNVPTEFVILNHSDDAETAGEQSRSETTNSPKPTSTTTTTTPAPTTTTSTTRKKKPKKKRPTTTTTEAPTTTKPSRKVIKDDRDTMSSNMKCKGTCVAEFFSFLCDERDHSGFCPKGGRCCIAKTRKKTETGSQTRPEETDTKQQENKKRRKNTPKPQTPKPKRRKPTTTTRRRTTTTTTTLKPEPISAPLCVGTCLPISVASRCASPSRLVVSSNCLDDEICCDDKGKRQPPSSSGSLAPSLGTLLSLFGGGGGFKNEQSAERRTRPPPRRTTTPTTTTTTTTIPTTTTTPIPIPDCPGTCISPIISFTCFGNAEISDMFKCDKNKQACCAPKSAIRELNRHQQLNNIAKRNDTLLTPPYGQYQPYGPHYFNGGVPFDPSQYQINPYEQPNIHQGNFPTGDDNNQDNFYRPGLQPPPPPQFNNHQNQHPHQPTYEHPPPPFHGAPHPAHPSHAAHETPSQDQHFSYQNSPPDHEARVPNRHPNYDYDVENNPQYHPQPRPIYHQNQSSVYHYPSELTSTQAVPTTIAGLGDNLANNYICGVKGTNRAARVVGGEDSIPGEWCWQVALINSLNQYLCGGALIGTQWVLTAAHCVTNIVRSGDAIYVRVGDHDLTTRFGSPGAQTIPVATTYIHHNHNSQTLDNDIALLKLSNQADLGNGVCLVCLPARGVSQVAGKRCTVTGYGYMGETGPIPLRVREAEIPVVSDNECVRKINAVTEKIFILPASSFCAGGESGHDACQGDGGGPLVCNVEDYYELSGLVSWGFGCGRQDVPGVYVKVSSFIGWVNQIISVNNT